MSIYASLPAPSDDGHKDAYEVPLVYQGSHHLPSEDDERGGWVDLALIPGHVRYWRDNPGAPEETEPDDAPPDPYLRFGVNNETVVLTRRQVELVHETLTEWLIATEEKP